MTDSIISQACERNFVELNDDDESRQSLWNIVSITKRRIENESISSLFGQYFRDDLIPTHHIYQYAIIDYWMAIGNLMIVTIPVGFEPSADSETEEMNYKLKSLPSGVSAEFLGGLGDNDGRFFWSVPLSLNMIVGDTEYKTMLGPNGSAPLEVGYTTFVTSWWHLFNGGLLARWPYGHKNIYLMRFTGKLACDCFPDLSMEANNGR